MFYYIKDFFESADVISKYWLFTILPRLHLPPNIKVLASKAKFGLLPDFRA